MVVQSRSGIVHTKATMSSNNEDDIPDEEDVPDPPTTDSRVPRFSNFRRQGMFGTKGIASAMKGQPKKAVAKAVAKVLPGTHGRLDPYRPTRQFYGKFLREKGKPPGGLGEDEWDKIYNCADSKIYVYRVNRNKNLSKKARESGMTRDLAIDMLIERGILPFDYVDYDV